MGESIHTHRHLRNLTMAQRAYSELPFSGWNGSVEAKRLEYSFFMHGMSL